ncbi:dihydrolipoamide acetyltransferase family protein [Cyanobacterium sp. uoEpiScrs1]|uniref:dihydrolipoamide acetyltransferase family protein n=1 Tax=Cyanobacterium sp. uoEpiScrs1 TaxID=2976343 RepID=UPI00226AFCFF|nr:dihydrolipoamide acetyltransferase family protein [Cyanobacterium sp. uoEpiScrs1]
MIHDIFMPALSSTMTEGKIVSWTKSPGDKVEKGETVVVIESDKADMDVESFHEGYLATILVEAGQEAPVGEAIAFVADTQVEIAQAQQKNSSLSTQVPQKNSPTVVSISAPESITIPATTLSINTSKNNEDYNTNVRIIASPRAKKLAKKWNIDLTTLQGSGPYGRIVAEDVEEATGSSSILTTTPTSSSTAQSTPTPSVSPTPVSVISSGETVPLTILQKAVVQNMMATVQVPTYHVGYTITTDGLDKLYKIIKLKGVTMTALLAKAVAVTLQKHPLVNANYSDQGIHYNSSINVALAVAMPDGGLITPVLQNADQVDIYSLSRTWKDLVERARLKQLQPQEYKNGSITISNLGMFGVDRFDAILPPGQGAILAIGKSHPQVVVTPEGLTGVKHQMAVNITCDHRVIYGAHAAAFLQDLAKLIETDVQLLTM